jgi:hypothetical protein
MVSKVIDMEAAASSGASGRVRARNVWATTNEASVLAHFPVLHTRRLHRDTCAEQRPASSARCVARISHLTTCLRRPGHATTRVLPDPTRPQATTPWLPLAAGSRPSGLRTGSSTRGSRPTSCSRRRSRTLASRCAMSSSGSTNTCRRYSHRMDSTSRLPAPSARLLTLLQEQAGCIQDARKTTRQDTAHRAQQGRRGAPGTRLLSSDS